jgi:hypothetical protein
MIQINVASTELQECFRGTKDELFKGIDRAIALVKQILPSADLDLVSIAFCLTAHC